MTLNLARSIVGTVVITAIGALLVTPLCGGLLAPHACPMEIVPADSYGGGCQGPTGPGLKRQPMDCCVAPQSTVPRALTAAKLKLVEAAPVPTPATGFELQSARGELNPQLIRTPRSTDLFRLHTSLLL